MDRAIPTSNKLITKKIHDRHMQIHQSKIQNMKSSISRQAPQTFSHLKSNKKKIQVHEDKLSEMERQNRILLDKLTHIMKTNNHDGKNTAGPRSLNRDMRKRELVKITIENQAFLKRLQDQKSTYDRNLWEGDRKKHELYLKNICEYPFSLVNTSKTPAGDQRPSTFHLTKEDSFSVNHGSPNNKFHLSSKNFQPSGKKMPAKLDPVTPSASQASQKEILYQTKKKIGFSNYLVHIYIHNNVFTIIASNNDRSDFKTFTMPARDSGELLRQFGNNFDQLVNHIKFKGSKIAFDNISFSTEFQNSKDIPNYTSDSTTQIAEVHNENEHEHDHEATHSKSSKQEISQQNQYETHENEEPTGESQKVSSVNHAESNDNQDEAVVSKEEEEAVISKEEEEVVIPNVEEEEEEHQKEVAAENVEDHGVGNAEEEQQHQKEVAAENVEDHGVGNAEEVNLKKEVSVKKEVAADNVEDHGVQNAEEVNLKKEIGVDKVEDHGVQNAEEVILHKEPEKIQVAPQEKEQSLKESIVEEADAQPANKFLESSDDKKEVLSEGIVEEEFEQSKN